MVLKKLLLDTNAYVHLRRGNQQVLSRVRSAERIYFSAVVVGELLYGFHHGSRFRANFDRLLEFLDTGPVELVEVDLETADRFGRVSAALRAAGTPIPTNDVWIAAHALQTGALLVTFDRHFGAVGGLPVDLLTTA